MTKGQAAFEALIRSATKTTSYFDLCWVEFTPKEKKWWEDWAICQGPNGPETLYDYSIVAKYPAVATNWIKLFLSQNQK